MHENKELEQTKSKLNKTVITLFLVTLTLFFSIYKNDSKKKQLNVMQEHNEALVALNNELMLAATVLKTKNEGLNSINNSISTELLMCYKFLDKIDIWNQPKSQPKATPRKKHPAMPRNVKPKTTYIGNEII